MDNKPTKLDEFKIIGISVRTSNLNAQSQQDIGALWSLFMKDHLIEKIPCKVKEHIYCVFTDYENDQNGAYTTVIGCPVKTLDEIPPGFIGITIPTCNYLVYKSQGKIPDCVLTTWKHIWSAKIDRKYIADFDVYIDHQTGMEVYTYVSVN
jgi:predicted transcriptional regulator YdeE